MAAKAVRHAHVVTRWNPTPRCPTTGRRGPGAGHGPNLAPDPEVDLENLALDPAVHPANPVLDPAVDPVNLALEAAQPSPAARLQEEQGLLSLPENPVADPSQSLRLMPGLEVGQSLNPVRDRAAAPELNQGPEVDRRRSPGPEVVQGSLDLGVGRVLEADHGAGLDLKVDLGLGVGLGQNLVLKVDLELEVDPGQSLDLVVGLELEVGPGLEVGPELSPGPAVGPGTRQQKAPAERVAPEVDLQIKLKRESGRGPNLVSRWIY